MATFKTIGLRCLLCLMCVALWQCSSAQKLQEQVPFSISEIYYQHWVAGVKGGGAGTNIFMKLENPLPEHIILNSIYFQNYQTKLKPDTHNNTLYVGRVLKPSNQQELLYEHPSDEVNSDEVKTPKFKLKPNECVVSFNQNGTIKYYKTQGVYEKELPRIPSVKPQ